MLRIGIVGASGYTGVELARILAGHPRAEITVVTSRQYVGQPLSRIFPSLRDRVDTVCVNPSPAELARQADFFFTAVPHKTAMDIVPPLLAAGRKVVDLSADFRIRDVAVYEQWYQKHSSSELIKEAVYGLPELYRQQIKDARLVANPGCYPTSVTLGLAPLLREHLIDTATIIIDAKSGTTGAGRAANVASLYCEVADGFRAYKVGGTHRHIPEMEQELSLLAAEPVTITFTPHLLPVSRGILSTMYARLDHDVSETELQELFDDTYRDEQFVRVCAAGTLPATQYVRGSNYCDIGFKIDRRTGRIIVITAIDNIAKGAAGQAVQNMNLMNNLDEAAGLTGTPFFP
ncbi:MAG TPA: N-acetyl-gamma-glutamyl-phosphate reductase [Desulfobacteraceae bacterium]|nr:N-acetyl-gamma-glutamyl-phosphate reductase [Desulfobacteraceae bacterium]